MNNWVNRIRGLTETIAAGAEHREDPSSANFLSLVYDQERDMGWLDFFVAAYANNFANLVRSKVPEDKKHLIHPAVLVRSEKSGELRDILILDNLDI